jgi:hypothetical protein
MEAATDAAFYIAKRRTLVIYHATGDRIVALIEILSLGIGRTLPDMPLFLTPGHYIYVPLEETYMAAWRGVPQRWRRVIEPPSAPSH